MTTYAANRLFWLDDLNRHWLNTGELKARIEAGEIVGATTNPARLERAIGEGEAYDSAVMEVVSPDVGAILEALIRDDVQAAADVFLPRYEAASTSGVGMVSVDISPLGREAPAALLEAARQTFRLIDRPNVLIKLPALPTTLTTIEEALYEGINVHITEVYSVAGLTAAAESYLRALERRLMARLPVNRLHVLIGFNVGAVDAHADMLLQGSIRAAQQRGDIQRVSSSAAVLGKVGLANADAALRRTRDLFYGERFSRLRQTGAVPPRLVWSDLTPRGGDLIHYLDALDQPECIALVSPEVLAAHRQRPADDSHPITPHIGAEVLDRLRETSIDLDMVARLLQGDAEDAHAENFRKVLARVEGKRTLLTSGFMRRQKLVLGQYQAPVEAMLRRLRQQKSITRTWAHDATLWKDSPEHIAIIEKRLGWLTIATDGRIDVDRLRQLRLESAKLEWAHVVLLGMGASANIPEVLWRIFGQQRGFPALIVLDSIDPAAIKAVHAQIDPAKTLFVVASKTGNTVETVALTRYFHALYAPEEIGAHFVAITDAGSNLAAEAEALRYRHLFLNPEDMAGRFAALSYFGLVPAALIGLDVEKLIERGAEMQLACDKNVMGNNHPGLWLGAVMGVLARRGLDKLTLITSPEIAALGRWIELLIAESAAKEDRGIIPISGATVGRPHDYDDDRLFVYLRVDGSVNSPDEGVQLLIEAGHPVVTLELRDVYDVGAEFFRWSFATAAACIVLGINPFDEPNVEESKQNTQRILDAFCRTGVLAEPAPILTEAGISLYAEPVMGSLLDKLRTQQALGGSPLEGMIAAFLRLARSGDYIGLLAYLPPLPEIDAQLEDLRRRARHTFLRAVTLDYGPRYLHSTGQLHKGGPDKGVLVVFTTHDSEEVPVPGLPYGFSILKQAQAAGDFEAIQGRGRRIIRLHLGNDIAQGLAAFARAIQVAAEKRK
jgi:transaldolase/glucose-6-phosphate isomerase